MLRTGGGRASVRAVLHMGAISASRHNPVLRAMHEGPIAGDDMRRLLPSRIGPGPPGGGEGRAQRRPALMPRAAGERPGRRLEHAILGAQRQ